MKLEMTLNIRCINQLQYENICERYVIHSFSCEAVFRVFNFHVNPVGSPMQQSCTHALSPLGCSLTADFVEVHMFLLLDLKALLL